MFGFDPLAMVAGVPGLLIALVIHEYAHALIAAKMGDDTAAMAGRLTLNPLAHIDPIGTLMLLVAQFGWAKPVPINASNFRNWRQGEICVSLAGPVANIITGFVFFLLYNIVVHYGIFATTALSTVLLLVAVYNVNFAIFNLIPLPPLDGSHVLRCFLPTEWAYRLASIERYSFLILIALMMTPFFAYILIPLRNLFFNLFGLIISPLF